MTAMSSTDELRQFDTVLWAHAGKNMHAMITEIKPPNATIKIKENIIEIPLMPGDVIVHLPGSNDAVVKDMQEEGMYTIYEKAPGSNKCDVEMKGIARDKMNLIEGKRDVPISELTMVIEKVITGRPQIVVPDKIEGFPIAEWQKTAYPFFTLRDGLVKTLHVIKGPGDDGKTCFINHLLSLPGKTGIMWRNASDNKKIVKMLTLSEDDEEEGVVPSLYFVMIDYTKTGDTRLKDKKHYGELEQLLNGSFLDQGWGPLRPHFLAVTNTSLIKEFLSGSKIIEHKIRSDNNDLGCLPKPVNNKNDIFIQRQMIDTMQLDDPSKTIEELWIKHRFDGDGEEKDMNTTQMMNELYNLDDVTFRRYKPVGNSQRAGRGCKGSFIQLMDKCIGAKKLPQIGSTVSYRVKRPRDE